MVRYVRADYKRFLDAVHRKTRWALGTIFMGPDYKERKHTLLFLISIGMASCLLDMDHFAINATQMVRPLHLPVLFGLLCIVFCYYSYLNRRVHNTRMRK